MYTKITSRLAQFKLWLKKSIPVLNIFGYFALESFPQWLIIRSKKYLQLIKELFPKLGNTTV